MSEDASNFVEAGELKDAKRARILYVLLFAAAAIVFGISAIANFNDLVAEIGWNWAGVAAAGQLVNPLMFAILSFQEYKRGVDRHD